MPVPIAAAGVAAARRAVLSAARKRGREVRERLKPRRQAQDKREQISWIEIFLVGGLALLFNDLPDIANVTIIAQVITGPIDAITAIFISFWFWWRVGENVTRTGVKNGAKFLVELIPFVGIFPFWTLSILNVKLKWFDWLFNLPVKILKMISLG